jgi:hypothetical protein
MSEGHKLLFAINEILCIFYINQFNECIVKPAGGEVPSTGSYFHHRFVGRPQILLSM